MVVVLATNVTKMRLGELFGYVKAHIIVDGMYNPADVAMTTTLTTSTKGEGEDSDPEAILEWAYHMIKGILLYGVGDGTSGAPSFAEYLAEAEAEAEAVAAGGGGGACSAQDPSPQC